MFRVVSRFSRAIQKSTNILKQMRDNRHYINEPIMSQKQEAEKIVEQLYFTPKKEFKEEEEKITLPMTEEINFRKFQTAKELLDFYESHSLNTSEYFVNWFNQLCYCVKFQSQIQENKRNHYKYIAGKYKAQYNKEYQMPEIIFLTPIQIIESPIFTNVLVDFVTYTEVDAQVEVRKNLTRTFKTIVYSLDFYVLQRIWEDNNYPIQTIQYLSLMIKDISIILTIVAEARFDKNQEAQFLELFEGKIKQGQNLKKTLESLLLEKMQKIDFKVLNNQDFTDYIFIYYQQQKMPIIPQFINELVDHSKERVSSLTLLQNVKICQTLVAVQVGDSQLFTYLLWNIIRLKNQIMQNREALNGILFILMHFRQNLFFFKQSKYYAQPILVRDIMIFPEIFNVVSQNISEYNYVQLNQLLIIAYQNFTPQLKFDAIITALYKRPEAFENVQINHKIDLIYKSTQAGTQELDVSKLLKQKVLQMSSRTVQGFFEKSTQTQDQITVYQPYYTQELNNLVRLLWVCIVQNSKQFEDLNYLIFKINEMTALSTIIKLDRNIQRQISQINQFINLRGKKMFPNKIDFQQILNNKLIFRKQESYSHPLKLHTKLFVKEKQYFSMKYAKDIQKDVLYQDVLFDYVYTNPQTGDQALILLNSVFNDFNQQNQYFISEVGQMIPNTQIEFQQSLLEEANIPVVQIDLPDLINCREKSHYERELKQILGEGSQEFENIIEKIKILRTELEKDFNYVSSFVEQPSREDTLQSDKYDLSDHEE